jgi:hypothetical protein
MSEVTAFYFVGRSELIKRGMESTFCNLKMNAYVQPLIAAYFRFGMVKHSYGIVDCFSMAGIQA